MTKRTRLSLNCGILALVAALPAGQAFAESAPAKQAAEASQAGEVGEIIVTARKREETLISVPVVETAISGARLQALGGRSFQNLVSNVPGLVAGDYVGAVGTSLSIRGIGTLVPNPALDQSVSVNIDGFSFTQGLALRSGLFDVGQVEVLKGPQALFFGKGSPAGVVSLRTNDPGGKFELIGSAGYEAEAHEKTGDLIISGPLSDTFGARLALTYGKSDGYFYNRARPDLNNGGIGGGLVPKYSRYGPHEDFIGRLTLKADPAPNFRAKLKLTYASSKVLEEGDGQLISCPEGTAGPIPVLVGDDCKLDRTVYVADIDPKYFPGAPNDGVPYSTTHQAYGILSLDYDPTSNLTVSSVTGYYDLRNSFLINGLQSGANPVLASWGTLKKTDFTQEVRLTSHFKDFPVNFMIAGFYENADSSYRQFLVFDTVLAQSAQFPSLLSESTNTIGDKVASVFGQLIYAVTPTIELTAGGRYTHEVKNFLQYGAIDLVGSSPPFFGPGVVANVNPRLASNRFSPELTATWRPSSDLTLFAAFKKGSKTGGFNTATLSSADQSFNDETTKGEEIGLKSRLFNRSLTLNLSAYNYDYNNLQVASVVTTASGAILLRTLNAASAKVRGVEFEGSWSPPVVPGLTLRGAVNYNHGRFQKFDTAPCYGGQTIALGCNLHLDTTTGLYTAQDLSGKPLVKAPDWTGSVGFDYQHPISGGLKLGFGGTGSFSGKYLANAAYNPPSTQRAFAKYDARVSLASVDNRWDVSVIGNNLTDRLTTGSCTESNLANGIFFAPVTSGGATQSAGGFNETACIYDRGRSVWLRLTVRPFAR